MVFNSINEDTSLLNSRVIVLDRQVDSLLKWREHACTCMALMEERLAILEERSIV